MTYTPESVEEREYLANYDPTKYPIILNTVDIIVHTTTHVLLVQRGNWPYKGYWALPGGFIDEGETTRQAAERELLEETTLTSTLDFAGVADRPDRDPRGRAISFVYAKQLKQRAIALGEDDATDAKWFDWRELPELAFDHEEILERYLNDEYVTKD